MSYSLTAPCRPGAVVALDAVARNEASLDSNATEPYNVLDEEVVLWQQRRDKKGNTTSREHASLQAQPSRASRKVLIACAVDRARSRHKWHRPRSVTNVPDKPAACCARSSAWASVACRVGDACMAGADRTS
jgi:hypothetical protein